MFAFASKQAAFRDRPRTARVLASYNRYNITHQSSSLSLASSLLTHRTGNGEGPQQHVSRKMMMFSRSFHTTRPLWKAPATTATTDRENQVKIDDMVSHNFPDFIEHWNRNTFRKVGYGLVAASALSFAGPTLWLGVMHHHPVSYAPSIALSLLTYGYWRVGLNDIEQTSHTLNRNFPVLGHVRYILEVLRPELRQYIVESDTDGKPYDRHHRSQIYQRAKNVDDTIPFGTRRNVYEVHHEWACHSMWPVKITSEEAKRTTVGTAEFGTTKPYSASVFNISGMSYGAISDNAILALNAGAKRGNFFQNTGEGGVSRFHIERGADLVWNIGTGCFGCGSGTGENRVFEPSVFQETLERAQGHVKMIEIKLSQGAKPGKGGILPRAKITAEIAEARRLDFPPIDDCHSPQRHASFNNAHELIEFIARVRDLSGGMPVGIKMCVGEPREIGELCMAMLDIGNGPDFITVDGAEGGTGAAPPELSNSVGQPLEEGLVLVRNLLIGAGLKDKVKINASGRVTSGFSLVRTLALGGDFTSAARAFMMSIGCIQALKCNTNKCPTGIATLDKELMYGLDPALKSTRVFNYHSKTVEAACDIVGVMGKSELAQVNGSDIMRRISESEVRTLAEIFPEPSPGCLLDGTATSQLQDLWPARGTHHIST